MVYEETEEFLGELMPTLDIFVEVLGRWAEGEAFIPTRLYINGFEICDDNMETYGWGVYLAPRFLNCSIGRPHQLFTNLFGLLNLNYKTLFSVFWTTAASQTVWSHFLVLSSPCAPWPP